MKVGIRAMNKTTLLIATSMLISGCGIDKTIPQITDEQRNFTTISTDGELKVTIVKTGVDSYGYFSVEPGLYKCESGVLYVKDISEANYGEYTYVSYGGNIAECKLPLKTITMDEYLNTILDPIEADEWLNW